MSRAKKIAWMMGLIIVLGVLGTLGTAAAWPPAGATNDAALLLVKGEVKQELRPTAADLKTMPRVKVTAKDHDGTARI